MPSASSSSSSPPPSSLPIPSALAHDLRTLQHWHSQLSAEDVATRQRAQSEFDSALQTLFAYVKDDAASSESEESSADEHSAADADSISSGSSSSDGSSSDSSDDFPLVSRQPRRAAKLSALSKSPAKPPSGASSSRRAAAASAGPSSRASHAQPLNAARDSLRAQMPTKPNYQVARHEPAKLLVLRDLAMVHWRKLWFELGGQRKARPKLRKAATGDRQEQQQQQGEEADEPSGSGKVDTQAKAPSRPHVPVASSEDSLLGDERKESCECSEPPPPHATSTVQNNATADEDARSAADARV